MRERYWGDDLDVLEADKVLPAYTVAGIGQALTKDCCGVLLLQIHAGAR